jgi:4-alpha-glucanotransferase
LRKIEKSHKEDIQYHKFLQFCSFTQWDWLKKYAAYKKVEILGDIPFYAAYDSCDIWSATQLFELDFDGNPLRKGGVPPDYFSQTGQLWGNPLYRWDVMKKNGYSWWLKRIEKALELVDWLRIDHFRGFQAFWAVEGESKTAENGEWIPGPGREFFAFLEKQLGSLPLVAEDLGMITPEVQALRKSIRIPGMRVIQFAFDGGPDNPHRPHNIESDSIVYTGTHDNNTTVGWLNSLSPETIDSMVAYCGCTRDTLLSAVFRTAYMSVASWCIVPFQDVLLLDQSHRMNTPGTADHNWQWRFTKEMISPERLAASAEYTELYGRYQKNQGSQ